MTFPFLEGAGVTLGPLKPGPPTSEVISPVLTSVNNFYCYLREIGITSIDNDFSPTLLRKIAVTARISKLVCCQDYICSECAAMCFKINY